MPHSLTLITTIAVSFALALVMGLIANRLNLPVLVGYLTAGVILGGNTPGFVADMDLGGLLVAEMLDALQREIVALATDRAHV